MPRLPLLSLLLLAVACKADPHAWDPDRVARVVTSADGDVGAVVDGNNAFTWDLYGQLATGDANLFFSPLSVAAALGMTSAGAAGDTLTQMTNALHVGLDPAEWHPAFGALTDDLNGAKKRGYTLAVANQLFGQDGTPWAAPFLATCADDWKAPLQSVDFVADPEASRDIVNTWVSDHTDAKIPELLPQGTITTDTRLVLANAITFVAKWWTEFDPADTRPGTFTRLDGSTVEADMMWLDLEKIDDARIRVTATDEPGADATVLRLPYEDDEVAAYLLIPSTSDGLPAVEAKLDAAHFDSWVSRIEGAYTDDGRREGMIGLPKFTMSWHSSLVPPLATLGMTDAFDELLADLSPMADGGAADNFYVSDVVHEAWIQIDEHGTEAAAATAVVVNDKGSTEQTVADHPFLFVIRDELTGSVLFVARVMDPTAG